MKYLRFILLLVFPALLVSCTENKNNPGYDYMGSHDMYYSKFYKAYSPNKVLANGQTNQLPPKGSVARGEMPFPYHPTNIGEKVVDQQKAGVELKNLVPSNKENLTEGKRQYEIFCVDCHGMSGKGDGHLYTAKLFPAKPRNLTGSYVQSMPDGTIYFIITQGSISGLMGPHGGQIPPENRWKIVNYLRTLAH